MKTILVCGAGGFIGHHLIKKLKSLGNYVIGVDLKHSKYENTACDKFFILDLSLEESWRSIEREGYQIDEIYQLAADMGGAGYIFTGDNDANIMHNSCMINMHCCYFATKWKSKVFYSSSACIYPAQNQEDPENPNCREDSAYPGNPDSNYGWEKLFSERLYKAFEKNYNLDVRIARFHNIYGPLGSWNNGKEKAPAAICRKIAMASAYGSIDVWGSGEQTRSFLFIDSCIEAIIKLMNSSCKKIINIGSTEKVTINRLVELVKEVAGKPNVKINHIDGPLGVMGRTSDNTLIKSELGWEPVYPLNVGLEKTYTWIAENVGKNLKDS